jgi:predicted PurR-regulated permease PerM
MNDLDKAMTASQDGDQYQPQWGAWTRQVIIVGLLIAVVYALTLLAPVMNLLSMTFLLSLVMFSPSRFMARQLTVPYRLAVTLCYAVVVLVLIVALARFIPASVDAATTLRSAAEQRYNQLQDTLQRYTPDQGVVTLLGIRVDLNFLIDPVRNLVLGSGQTAGPDTTLINTGDLRQAVTTLTELLTSAVSGLAGIISVSLMALFISFLVLLDLPNLSRALPNWIPPAYHRESSLLIQQIGAVWNGFFRGQALIAVIIAILTWLQLTLMGVQNTGIVAVFVGVISLIPTLGGIIALVPVAAIALLQGSTVFTNLPNGTFAVLVVVVNLIISQIIWNVVAPKILGDAVNLPLPIILVGVFIGAALGGILGAFLITPILGTGRVILVYLLKKIGRQDPYPGQEPTWAFATAFSNNGQAHRQARGHVVSLPAKDSFKPDLTNRDI